MGSRTKAIFFNFSMYLKNKKVSKIMLILKNKRDAIKEFQKLGNGTPWTVNYSVSSFQKKITDFDAFVTVIVMEKTLMQYNCTIPRYCLFWNVQE